MIQNKRKKADGESDEVHIEAIAPIEMNSPSLRTLCIIGEVNTATVGMFAGPFLSLDEEKGPIKVKICSAGGDVSAGMAIYDLLCSSKNQIITEGFGIVQSVATCIFQAGHIRRMYENCRFMAHSAKVVIPYPMTPKELSIENKELEDWNSVIVKILKGRSDLKKVDFEKILSQDVYFSAKEALDLGLCDEIIKNKRRRNVK